MKRKERQSFYEYEYISASTNSQNVCSQMIRLDKMDSLLCERVIFSALAAESLILTE